MLNYRSTTGAISFININQKKKEKKRKLSTAATNGKSDQQATTYLNGYISNHQLTLMHYPSDPSHPFMRTPDSLFGTATMTNMFPFLIQYSIVNNTELSQVNVSQLKVRRKL